MRKGNETFINKWEITDSVVHPGYDGGIYCGYDIAICKAKRLPGSNATTANFAPNAAIADDFSGFIDPKNL